MSPRLKILHYTGVYAPAWKWGGPPRSSANLAEGVASLGHEVTVFTTNAGLEGDASIPADRPVLRNGVAVHYFPSRFDLLGLRSSPLEAAVRARVREFDIVHVTGVWQPTSVAACRAAETAGVPYVVSPRGALGPYSWTQKPWKKYPYWWLWESRNVRRSSAVHVTSGMEGAECVALGICTRIEIIPNSIDLGVWRPSATLREAWRQQHQVGAHERLILVAGRLHHKKGLDILPEVLRKLPRDIGWRVVFIGHDEDGTGVRLAADFAALQLTDRVTFIGQVGTNALVEAYNGADVCLMPSRHENFGNVAVEALACGCPVLLSDQVGCASELAQMGLASALPRTSPEAWSVELQQILLDWRVARQRVKGRRERLEDRFSSTAVADAMAKLYRGLKSEEGLRNR